MTKAGERCQVIEDALQELGLRTLRIGPVLGECHLSAFDGEKRIMLLIVKEDVVVIDGRWTSNMWAAYEVLDRLGLRYTPMSWR
jgi:hypothetical protein